MNTTRNPRSENHVRKSAGRRAAVRRTAARSAWWVLCVPALALLATPVLVIAGAGTDWIAFIWLVAVLWVFVVSLVQALWRGFRYGDWSEFLYCDLPRNDDEFDYATKSGTFAHLQIQADHEALMRDGDRTLENAHRDHPVSS